MSNKVKGYPILQQTRFLFFLAALCCVPQALSAQDTTSVSRQPYRLAGYAALGYFTPVSDGRSGGLSADINLFFRSGPTFSTGYRHARMGAEDLPDDYQPGGGGLSFGNTHRDHLPKDYYRSVALKCGWKFYPAKSSRQIRLSMEAGPALVLVEKTVFTPQPVIRSGGLFPSYSSNYDTRKEAFQAVGAEASVRTEFIISNKIGFSMGTWYQSSPLTSMLGLDFSLLMGLVGDRQGYRSR